MLNSSKEVVLWFIKICVEEHLMPNIDVSANNLISTIQHHIALVKHMHHVLFGVQVLHLWCRDTGSCWD